MARSRRGFLVVALLVLAALTASCSGTPAWIDRETLRDIQGNASKETGEEEPAHPSARPAETPAAPDAPGLAQGPGTPTATEGARKD